ncbi:MAG: HEPN domain-containing protein [Oscillospiraceae bacterium]|nr:HEPN domain-containing protein [Oscillospiraceae bacterium]
MEFNERKALATYRLEQAKENLEEAHILFENNKLKGASNRSYYAMFHGMQAVVNLEGQDFKKHSGLIAHFNKHYINTEIFPREIGKSVSSATFYREKSDYDAFYIISRDNVINQIKSAEILIEYIEEYLAKELQKEDVASVDEEDI